MRRRKSVGTVHRAAGRDPWGSTSGLRWWWRYGGGAHSTSKVRYRLTKHTKGIGGRVGSWTLGWMRDMVFQPQPSQGGGGTVQRCRRRPQSQRPQRCGARDLKWAASFPATSRGEQQSQEVVHAPQAAGHSQWRGGVPQGAGVQRRSRQRSCALARFRPPTHDGAGQTTCGRRVDSVWTTAGRRLDSRWTASGAACWPRALPRNSARAIYPAPRCKSVWVWPPRQTGAHAAWWVVEDGIGVGPAPTRADEAWLAPHAAMRARRDGDDDRPGAARSATPERPRGIGLSGGWRLAGSCSACRGDDRGSPLPHYTALAAARFKTHHAYGHRRRGAAEPCHGRRSVARGEPGASA